MGKDLEGFKLMNHRGDELKYTVYQYGMDTEIEVGDGKHRVEVTLHNGAWNVFLESAKRAVLEQLAAEHDEDFRRIRCMHCFRNWEVNEMFLRPKDRWKETFFSTGLGEQEREKMLQHLKWKHDVDDMSMADIQSYDTRDWEPVETTDTST